VDGPACSRRSAPSSGRAVSPSACRFVCGLILLPPSTAICASGRQFQDGRADYRVCSRSRWDPRHLFNVAPDHLPQLLPSPEAPVFAVLDDTVLKKTGRHIPGVKILRDPMSLPFHVNLCYGLRFVQASVLVSPGEADGPARALPVRFDFAPPAGKPKKNAPPEDWANYKEEQKKRTLSLAGVETIRSLRESLDERPETRQRQLIVSGDGSYTNREVLKRLPERTTFIGRIRRDAKLYYPLPEIVSADKPQGRPRRYGPQAPTPDQILKDESIAGIKVRCFAAGQFREIPVKVLRTVYGRNAGVDMPLQVVVIKPLGYRLRNGSRVLYRQPAFLICTDPEPDLATLIQAYINRWEIECNHRDEKSLIGVEQGQVRNPNSVERLPQLQVAGYSLLLPASLLSSGFERTSECLAAPEMEVLPCSICDGGRYSCSPFRRLHGQRRLRHEVAETTAGSRYSLYPRSLKSRQQGFRKQKSLSALSHKGPITRRGAF
jgi:DDE superfamily endonuclease